MAACVPTLRPLFHRTWDRTTSGHGYSNPRSADIATTVSTLRRHRHRESALSRTDVGLSLADIGQKEYAESAESQQGIMRTMEVSVQRGRDGVRPISHTGDQRNYG